MHVQFLARPAVSFRSSRPWVLALLVAALAVSAACGDDDNGSPTAPSNTVGTVTLTATPASLPTQGGATDIVAAVRSASGGAMANQQVTFTTSKGTLSTTGAVATDGNGQARTRLTTTETATVRATVAGTNVASGDLNIAVKAPLAITTTVEPAEPVASEEATVTVTAKRGDANATGRLRLNFGNGDEVDAGDINGTKSVKYTYKSGGGYNLSATVQESDGSESRETIRLNVRDRGRSGGGGGDGRDDIDARQVRWFADCDISGWPIEEEVLDVSIGRSEICVDYSGRGTKGTFDIGIPVDGTLWVFAEFNGVWYGATWDHLRPGSFCKAESAESLGADQIRRAPMDHTWVPRSGDRIGFMVSGGYVRHECDPQQVWRTNIKLITWP